MKINTKALLKNLEGKNLELTVGKTIAAILSGSKSHDPLKAYILSIKFYTDNEVDIDVADLKFVKDSIKANEGFTPLAIGQLLQILEELKAD